VSGKSHPDFQTNILEVALGLVYGDRNADYGHPIDDYTATADLVNTLLGETGADLLKENLTAEHMMLVMLAVKLSRLSRNLDHRDTEVDIAGYTECLQRIQAERKRRATTHLEPIPDRPGGFVRPERPPEPEKPSAKIVPVAGTPGAWRRIPGTPKAEALLSVQNAADDIEHLLAERHREAAK
jgi:hypothetical protein